METIVTVTPNPAIDIYARLLLQWSYRDDARCHKRRIAKT
jgi:fructose-1-phosphate kinase PfkB-like protein